MFCSVFIIYAFKEVIAIFMIACICFCSLDFGANSWRPDDHKKNTRCECSQIEEWKTILKTLADDTGGRDVYVAIDCHVIWRSLINSLWSAPTCRNKASQHDHVNWGICNPSCCLLFVGMLYLICRVHDLSINKFNCTWKKFRAISILQSCIFSMKIFCITSWIPLFYHF